MKNIYHQKKGFTLIELVLVISIIGILTSMIMFLINPLTQFQKARDGQRKSDLRQIQSALEMYRSDQGSYPASFKNCPVSSPTDLGNLACTVIYKKNVPDDPSGGAYTYSSSGTTYSLIACLENQNDPQGDTPNNPVCNGTTRFSYTLQNP